MRTNLRRVSIGGFNESYIEDAPAPESWIQELSYEYERILADSYRRMGTPGVYSWHGKSWWSYPVDDGKWYLFTTIIRPGFFDRLFNPRWSLKVDRQIVYFLNGANY